MYACLCVYVHLCILYVHMWVHVCVCVRVVWCVFVCACAYACVHADSLVGFDFDVSALLELAAVLVPAEGGAGVAVGYLTAQLQLLALGQRLTSEWTQLRRRGWRERGMRDTHREKEG